MQRWADLIGPLVIPRSRRRTVVVLAIATVLFAGILVGRLQNTDEGNGILALELIPIALVALELGLLPGMGVAAAAMGATAYWAVTKDVHINAVEYLFRAGVFFPIAIMVGWSAGRLQVAERTIGTRERRLRMIVESSTDALITSDDEGRILSDGLVEIDFTQHRATIDGTELDLTPTEFRLLAALARHPNQVLSHDQLLELAWGDAVNRSRQRVNLYIGYLRRKLADTADDDPIETVRGFGYRYSPKAASAST